MLQAVRSSLSLQVVGNLVAQQLAVRYRRAWMGVAWMMLVPLATMSVMGVALSAVFRVKTGHIVAHIVASLLPFTLFQSAVMTASTSLVANQDIIRRHSVNRWVFPISAVLLCVVEYLVASLSLVVLGPLLGMHLSWALLVLPLGFVCICLAAAGLGLMGAIGTVHFRDLTQLIQVGLGLLYWATPIIYTLEMVPDSLRRYLYFNPLVAMLAMYTEPLLDRRLPPLEFLIAGPATAAAFLALGSWVFLRNARNVVFHL